MSTKRLTVRCALASILLFPMNRFASAEDDVVPLSRADSAQLDNPNLLWTPDLRKSIDQHPVILGAILFDGTRNDRLHIPTGERQTIEGHLKDELDTLKFPIFHYYAGAGTQTGRLASLWDAVFGTSVKDTAEKAADVVISQTTKLRQNEPDSDVRLLVSGFSRGAAAARHFMNILDQRWNLQKRIGSPPRFYALIFDTVATGQRTSLQLQVPDRADIFYHFVSKDERRILFRLILDEPLSTLDGRVETIVRPGAHSDVGASYPTGIGSEYVTDTDALLFRMGLTAQNTFTIHGDVRAQGKNDSRWSFERAVGIGSPNTPTAPKYRSTIQIPIPPMSVSDHQQWEHRMFALSGDGPGSLVRETYREILSFIVRRSPAGLAITSATSLGLLNSTINRTDFGYVITYSVNGGLPSSLPISPSILESVSAGKSIQLDLSVHPGTS